MEKMKFKKLENCGKKHKFKRLQELKEENTPKTNQLRK